VKKARFHRPEPIHRLDIVRLILEAPFIRMRVAKTLRLALFLRIESCHHLTVRAKSEAIAHLLPAPESDNAGCPENFGKKFQ
jgi:hypothetical protein